MVTLLVAPEPDPPPELEPLVLDGVELELVVVVVGVDEAVDVVDDPVLEALEAPFRASAGS